jgi:hypothetical protein
VGIGQRLSHRSLETANPDKTSLEGGAQGLAGSETDLRHDDLHTSFDGTAWRGWLTATTATEAIFPGAAVQTYYFRVRATDQVGNVGNLSPWQPTGLVTIDTVTKYYPHGDERVALRQGGEVYYLYGDHLGSTSLTTDETGAVVAEARYRPFGQECYSQCAKSLL